MASAAGQTWSALPKAALFLLVIAYAIIIPLGAGLGPLDDHNLLSTLYAGKSLPMDIFPASGRFYPLDAQELNLIALFSTAPAAFYLVNVVQLLILVPVFLDFNRRLSSLRYALFAAAFLLLTPGFAIAWTRLQIPERDVLFFFALSLWSYERYQSSGGIACLVGTLITSNIGMYYKEPGFVAIGTFAFVRLLLAHRKARSTTFLLDVSLLASSFFFALIYYFVIYRHHESGHFYGQATLTPAVTFVRNAGNYLLSDPAIMLGMPAVSLWRLTQVARERKIEPLGDSLLVAAWGYLPLFFVLGFFSPYYLLPVYVFALPAFGVYWRSALPSGRPPLRAVGSVVLILTLLSSLPMALFNLSFNKYVVRNYDGAVAFLANRLRSQSNKVTIYLDGVNPDRGVEIFVSLTRFLAASGVNPSGFSIQPFPNFGTIHARSGDYLVITPFDEKNVDAHTIPKLRPAWKLLWASHSAFAVPDAGIKAALKYAAIHSFLHQHTKEIAAIEKYTYPVDYYVLVRR